MASFAEFSLRFYGFLVRIPIVGFIIRLPARIIRAVTLPVIRSEIAKMQGDPQTGGPTLAALFDTTTSLQSQIQGLWQRVEFVRAEAMFEMRALMSGSGDREISYKTDIDAQIKSKAKLEAALTDQTVRLNIGCGHIPMDGYFNVDGRDLPGVDIVSDVASIPLEDASATEIFSSHLLEHFPLEHLKRVVLPHWYALLRAGGILRAIVPDAEGMIDDYANGQMSFDDLREVTFGLQEYEGDFHFNMFSRDMLTEILQQAGFGDIKFEFVNRKNGKCRDMEIQGIKT